MKKLLAKLTVFLIAFVVMATVQINPTWAGDVGNGSKIFSANCAACHMGGGNVVNGAKTLKKDALEKYEMYDVVAIKNQIMKGKNAMPGFMSKLTAEDIDDVATYVLSQADKGWK